MGRMKLKRIFSLRVRGKQFSPGKEKKPQPKMINVSVELISLNDLNSQVCCNELVLKKSYQ